ncbi:MAG: hypothetical protein IPP66_18815 [Anaerolineales bacterium]|nr:hypothetical protein [Anaerolineales bacterium]
MQTRKIFSAFLGALLFTACGAVTPIPSTEAAYQYPTPQIPVEIDPFAPSVSFKQASIAGNDELYIGKYILRNWCKPLDFMDYCAITISTLNEKQVDIVNWHSYISHETGTDLTGTGIPNIVIISEIGNAAGEQFIRIFEAGDSLKEILFIGSRRDWKFEDLNNDKAFEFIGDARVWSKFSDCQILNFPYVQEYTPNVGYTIGTHKYKEILYSSIQYWLENIDTYKKENPGTEIPLCRVYGVVAAYLVSGQTEKAWAILDTNYSPDKAAEYKVGFQEDLKNLLP